MSGGRSIVPRNTDTPPEVAPPLNLVCFASRDVELFDDELDQALSGADLVVALGNVNLERIANILDPRQPALAVLGPEDPQKPPPPPFRALHGNGVTFRHWRICGVSGGPRTAQSGEDAFTLAERDAAALIGGLPACDILLTYAPAAGIAAAGDHVAAGEEDGVQVPEFPPGFAALDAYLEENPPAYHFYAHPHTHVMTSYELTDAIGVCGVLAPPTLLYV